MESALIHNTDNLVVMRIYNSKNLSPNTKDVNNNKFLNLNLMIGLTEKKRTWISFTMQRILSHTNQ